MCIGWHFVFGMGIRVRISLLSHVVVLIFRMALCSLSSATVRGFLPNLKRITFSFSRYYFTVVVFMTTSMDLFIKVILYDLS